MRFLTDLSSDYGIWPWSPYLNQSILSDPFIMGQTGDFSTIWLFPRLVDCFWEVETGIKAVLWEEVLSCIMLPLFLKLYTICLTFLQFIIMYRTMYVYSGCQWILANLLLEDMKRKNTSPSPQFYILRCQDPEA